MANSFNETIKAFPSESAIRELTRGVLASSDHLKIVRLPQTAGEVVAEHKAKGDISVICIAGHVHFKVGDTTHHLEHGDIVCLTSGTLHSVESILDSLLLVTVCVHED